MATRRLFVVVGPLTLNRKRGLTPRPGLDPATNAGLDPATNDPTTKSGQGSRPSALARSSDRTDSPRYGASPRLSTHRAEGSSPMVSLQPGSPAEGVLDRQQARSKADPKSPQPRRVFDHGRS